MAKVTVTELLDLAYMERQPDLTSHADVIRAVYLVGAAICERLDSESYKEPPPYDTATATGMYDRYEG